MRRLHYLFAAVVAFGAVACQDPLTVRNDNSPDKALALSRPVDVEALIAGAYNTAWVANHGSTAALAVQMANSGLESYSALGNYGMGMRAAMPRVAIDNAHGAPPSENSGSPRDFQRFERAARAAALGLQSLNRTGFTIGSAARDKRARAFAHFVKGVALAQLALSYDSGAVVSEYDDPAVVPPLVAYDSLMRAALFYIDSAITLSGGTAPAGPASDWFPLPATWLKNNTPASMTAVNFIALCRTLKAKFRTQNARTPAERAAVNWAAVIADGQAGLGTNFVMDLTPSGGWDEAMLSNNNSYTSWAQGMFFLLAFADTSHTGTTYLFDTFLGTTPAYNRQAFLVQTPDLRFPRGATRTLQQGASTPGGANGFPYYRNRTAADLPGDALAFGYYDHVRFIALQVGPPARTGPFIYIPRAETNLLIAEGLIRTGNVAGALPWIDSTRVRAGLPALATAVPAIVDTVARVPGGTGCAPRIPAPPTYTTTVCANVWEAMKHEMRMETALTGWGQWFFYGRGMGDLPEGTPFHWPVPYQEMDARVTGSYNMGGPGVAGGAARGTYGLWAGGLY